MGSLQRNNENTNQEKCQCEAIDLTDSKKSVQQFQKRNSRKLLFERRASPRFKNIPEEKRPYYGPERRGRLGASKDGDNDQKRQLDPSEGKGNKKRIIGASKDEYIDQMKQLDSPKVNGNKKNRLRGAFKDDNNYQKRQLDSPEDTACKKKRLLCASKDEDSDQKRQLDSPEGNSTKNNRFLRASKDKGRDQKGQLNSPGCKVNMKETGPATTKTDNKNEPTLDSAAIDEDDDYKEWTDYESFIADSSGQNARKMVRETLRTFNKLRLQFVQKGKPEGGSQRSISRPDLRALTEMLNEKKILYPEPRIGHLPGILVGDKFFSRSAMAALGLHRHWLCGIDYIGENKRKLKNSGHTCSLALAIVLSGQYEDDADHSDEVVYTGSGGNDLLGKKKQIKDQVLERGNLALKNSMDQHKPVRVIRGHKDAACNEQKDAKSSGQKFAKSSGQKVAKTSGHKVYTYCGLYKVVDYWTEKGISGFTVYKYRLKRLQGQPDINVEKVYFERDKTIKGSSVLPGLVCHDISDGKEDIRIPATNLVDIPPIAPTGFTYARAVQVPINIAIPPNARGCSCIGKCTNPKTCDCARRNGSDFPYVAEDGGRLIEAKDVVYECGPECGCGPDCINRVSQRGLKYRLEVFRTENKGWAVRSWDFIPSGAPVCEYTGVLKRNDELDNVSENDFIFDIDCWHTMNGIGGRERRQGDAPVPQKNQVEEADDKLAESQSEFSIDAGPVGGVARFINHSCEPNLFVQCVLSSHHDVRFARVVLFASDDIPPMQELSYDYGYELDSVVGPDGKLKQMPCHCGSNECRGRLY